MKIVLCAFTGTVGKTTIAANVLAPRMTGAEFIAIETINQSASDLGVDVETLKGSKFRQLFRRLLTLEDAIIDVGHSNVEDFISGLKAFDESHLEFDRWVVPVTSGQKEQQETCVFLAALHEIGVPLDRIRIVFNRVEDNAAEEFGIVIAFAQRLGIKLDGRATIFDNEVFNLTALKQLTLGAVLADTTDWRAVLSSPTATEREVDKALDMISLRSLARGISKQLDAVFASIVE